MNKVFCLIFVLCFSVSGVNATVSNDQLMSETFLKNQNYSNEVVRLVKMQKYGATEEKEVKKASFWKKLNAYLDPAADDSNFGMRDIKYSNSPF